MENIRRCSSADVPAMFEIINAAAEAYRGVIPPDRWREPYMPLGELEAEIADGVQFHGLEQGGGLLGIMGIQDKSEVQLIRHAYVLPEAQGRGVGRRLLERLTASADKPLLVGTWAAAEWAVRFYENNGFRLTTTKEKDRLLKTYWNIPERQVETSVVLAKGLDSI